MSRLDVAGAVERAAGFDHAVVSFVDQSGYPTSVAGAFVADAASGVIEVGPLSSHVLPAAGQEIGLTFSHIRPRPGVGYDERRYVNVWGPATVLGDRIRVAATRATGWDEEETPFFEYAERSLARGRRYLDDVGARPRLSRWWTFFLATRLPFLTATVVPVALGGAVAARDHAFSWGWFLLALAGACAVHLGLNIANDLFDDASGADAANVTPTPFSGGSRVIQYGLVSRRAMRLAGVGFYAVAIAIGVYLAAARGWWLLAIGGVGLFLSIEYTGPPLRLVHHGLGEPVTAAGFGPVMVTGAYYACAGRWSWEAFYVSLPIALLIASVLYVNQVPDRAADAAVGKRTLIVRWPEDRVVVGYLALAVAAFAVIAVGPVAAITPGWTLVALAPFPLAVKVWRGLAAHYNSPYELMAVMQTNIGLHLFTGLLVLAGYLIDVAVR
jgi:1,4-dihydroxy-2-naphthoate polyprenyltransferase